MSDLNLYQKLVRLKEYVAIEGLNKDSKGYKGAYVTGNQILYKIQSKLTELNLLLVPETMLGSYETHNYKTKRGESKTDFIVSGEMNYYWINADKPDEVLKCNWAYYGQQEDISQAYGSGLTYAERYFLLKFLGVATDEDDPDIRYKNNINRASKQKEKKDPKQAVLISILELTKMKNLESNKVAEIIKEKYKKNSSNELTMNEAIDLQKYIAGM